MLEKRFPAVAPQALTSDGTSTGVVTVADTSLFKVKQEVILSANTLPNRDDVEVKNVLSPTQLVVGPKTGDITSVSNVSAYTVALSAAIFANAQLRPKISSDHFERAVYEEEPTVAKRVILVDKFGQKYETDNPLPVQLSDGSINIGTVNANLDVQLTDKESAPGEEDYDVTRVGDGVNQLKVNTDGSINVILENSVDQPEVVVSEFNQVSSVASSVTTNLLTFSIPVAKRLILTRVEVGGTNIATYELYINNAISGCKRTWFSGSLNETFDFTSSTGGFELSAGDTVQVKVIHFRPDLGDFEARLQGLLIG